MHLDFRNSNTESVTPKLEVQRVYSQFLRIGFVVVGMEFLLLLILRAVVVESCEVYYTACERHYSCE